jgi:hypothetical protein
MRGHGGPPVIAEFADTSDGDFRLRAEVAVTKLQRVTWTESSSAWLALENARPGEPFRVALMTRGTDGDYARTGRHRAP